MSSVTTQKIDQVDYKGFLYPLYHGYEEKIQKGKEIFKVFIEKAYPFDSDKIFEIFDKPETIIQDSPEEITIKRMLEAEFFGYRQNSALQKFMYGYFENFGAKDSILGRMYYRCYIIHKLTEVVSNECLYEIFFDILQMIDNKYGTKCSYIINQDLRNKNFLILKRILKKYGFQIKDAYKSKYITALLDRKYATYDEAQLFPQFEQLGDAIYELAVDNILFYNPKTCLNHSKRENLVKAEAQIKVSKKVELDKAYISELHDSMNSKYLDYEKTGMGLQTYLQGNYIADSLEMVIGVLSLEFGIQKALDFTTKIILEANPELIKPQIEKFDIVDLYNSNIDKDYLDKIYPSPFNFDFDDYYEEYDAIWHAIVKLLKICIIGNDTKEKRQMISYSAGKLFNRVGLNNNYEYVVTYLYYGIETTIEKYRPIVESSYWKSKE